MTKKIDDADFIAAYNNTRQFQGIAAVAAHLGISKRAVKGRASRMRLAGTDLVDRHQAYADRLRGESGEVYVPDVPTGERPIEEVIELAMAHSDRVIEAARARELVDVHIDIDGPFAVFGLPDPHLDNPGSHLRRAIDHARLIRETEGVYALCVGDILDNFHAVRPLAHARNEHVVTVSEGFRLQEAWLEILAPKLVGVSSGNHDDWAARAGVDPLTYALKQLGKLGLYGISQVRIRLNTPNGQPFTHLIRHQFPGNSIYNSGHGILRWALQQWQGEDVMWGGHIHSSAIQQLTKPSHGSDKTVTLMQLGSYKVADHYALERGFRRNTPHDAALVVHDPATGETIPFGNVERGVEYLKFLRAEWKASKKARAA